MLRKVNTHLQLERKERFRVEREDKGSWPVNEFAGITEALACGQEQE